MNTMTLERTLNVGDPAPDFELENETGEKIRLSELQGRPVILIFYPFDWSGGCTKELCGIRDNNSDWESTGAHVFGISRDSKYSHKAWKDHLGLNYSLLADLRGDVAKMYGAWNESSYRADRMTVVIDQEGTVRHILHNDAGSLRDHTEALNVARSLSD